MNQTHGAQALLTRPHRSGDTIMNPVGDEAPRKAHTEDYRPKRQYLGRRPSHTRLLTSESSRPSAYQLSSLVQDYSNRIDECEAKRDQAEAQIDDNKKRRNIETKRHEAEWQRQESLFKKRIQAAFLDDIWDTYTHQYNDADHTHELAFLGWAHSSGAYPHGIMALEQDWQNAVAGRPVTQRHSPNQSRPQRGQREQRQTYNRTNTRPSQRQTSNTTNGQARTSRPANAKASATSPNPTSHPQQPAAVEDHKAPLNTRNWVIIGILAGAAIIAITAVIFGG